MLGQGGWSTLTLTLTLTLTPTLTLTLTLTLTRFGQRMDVELLGHIFLLFACSILLSGTISFDNVQPTGAVLTEVDTGAVARRELKGSTGPIDPEDPDAIYEYGNIADIEGTDTATITNPHLSPFTLTLTLTLTP